MIDLPTREPRSRPPRKDPDGLSGAMCLAGSLRRTQRAGLRPFRGRREGFSLLEVVLTVALLTSITLGTTLLIVPVARQSRIGRETQVANAAARRVLEQIQATPFNEVLSTYPPSSDQPIPELPAGKVAVAYEDPAADPLVVQVEVTWDSPDLGGMSRAFHTVRTE